MLDNILLSLKGISSHKLRSFLTMLGIIIGISSIIAIVSTIKGTNLQIQKNLIGSGTNVVNVVLGEEDIEFGRNKPKIKQLSEQHRKMLLEIDGVKGVSFYNYRQEFGGINYLNNNLTGGKVYGIDQYYFDTNSIEVFKGRAFNDNDYYNQKHICIIDENTAKQLFNNHDVLGMVIEIKGNPFVVVGIARNRNQYIPTIKTLEEYNIYNQDIVGKIFILNNTWPLVYQYDEAYQTSVKISDINKMTGIGKRVEKVLNDSLGLTGSFVYKAEDLMKQAQQLQQLSNSTNLMLVWIAAISLLVGGIGVMNIMLVSVSERTAEIGLKKAIGAHKKYILGQFLTEATVLCFIGGVLGVIFGIVLALVISKVNNTLMAISVEASILSVIFSMLIGIVFGIIPAIKAANLNPIDALRRE